MLAAGSWGLTDEKMSRPAQSAIPSQSRHSTGNEMLLTLLCFRSRAPSSTRGSRVESVRTDHRFLRGPRRPESRHHWPRPAELSTTRPRCEHPPTWSEESAAAALPACSAGLPPRRPGEDSQAPPARRLGCPTPACVKCVSSCPALGTWTCTHPQERRHWGDEAGFPALSQIRGLFS